MQFNGGHLPYLLDVTAHACALCRVMRRVRREAKQSLERLAEDRRLRLLAARTAHAAHEPHDPDRAVVNTLQSGGFTPTEPLDCEPLPPTARGAAPRYIPHITGRGSQASKKPSTKIARHDTIKAAPRRPRREHAFSPGAWENAQAPGGFLLLNSAALGRSPRAPCAAL